MNNKIYLENVRGIDFRNKSLDEVKELMIDGFMELYNTDFVSNLIADKDGNILIPGNVTTTRGRVYNAVIGVNINNPENIYETMLLVEDIGLLTVEKYIKYLGPWGDEFEIKGYEFYVRYITD